MRALGRVRHWLHEVDVNEEKLDSLVGIRGCLSLGAVSDEGAAGWHRRVQQSDAVV